MKAGEGQAYKVWGHRGASARFPENTLKAFAACLEDGADGIESDVHVTKDGIVLCCHDPHLDRTTTGRGLISEQDYIGGIDQLQSLKQPPQPVPTFRQTIELLCRPEYSHALFDIDIKVNNDPERLFSLMHEIISAQPDYETKLAPRLVLGLWHTAFIEPAKRHLPYCRFSHIGANVELARTAFWDHCYAFSIRFQVLMMPEGQQFIKEAHAAGKQVFVWTVNTRLDAIEAARWGCDVLITDHTKDMVKLKKEIEEDWPRVSAEKRPQPSWLSIRYNPLFGTIMSAWVSMQMQRSPVGPIKA